MTTKTTIEPCPICKNPDAECEHLGNHQHFWHCDNCEDDWLAVVGYKCEVCNKMAIIITGGEYNEISLH